MTFRVKLCKLLYNLKYIIFYGLQFTCYLILISFIIKFAFLSLLYYTRPYLYSHITPVRNWSSHLVCLLTIAQRSVILINQIIKSCGKEGCWENSVCLMKMVLIARAESNVTYETIPTSQIVIISFTMYNYYIKRIYYLAWNSFLISGYRL